MRLRLLLSAWIAFGSVAPAAAQVRFTAPGSVSVVPAFPIALNPGAAASLSSPALSSPLAPGVFATGVAAPAAPIPALPASAITAAAAGPILSAGPAPAKDEAPRTALREAARLAETPDAGSSSALFDGSSQHVSLDEAPRLALPLGARGVSSVRIDAAKVARKHIADTSVTGYFHRELAANWHRIGWLDLRTYTAAKGGAIHAIDLSGRPELAERLPEVQPHEAALIRKIMLHSNDLQLVIREVNKKTPDLIVDGVMTEMKSMSRPEDVRSRIKEANEQVLAHATRHRLGFGAAVLNMLSRDVVPVASVRSAINDYVRSGAKIGVATISVYAGKDRRVFVRGANGLFDLAPASDLARFTPKRHKPRRRR